MTIREKSPRLYGATAQQYTLYWSAIYPILVSNIPYIGLQYTLYCFVAASSMGCWQTVMARWKQCRDSVVKVFKASTIIL